MVTHMEALKALEGFVTAGKPLEPNKHMWMPDIHSFDAEPFLLAFNGSLDAAQKLHEAVLPEWVVERLRVWPGVGASATLLGTHDVGGERWHCLADGKVETESDSPARAWLLAIIRALIAIEEGK